MIVVPSATLRGLRAAAAKKEEDCSERSHCIAGILEGADHTGHGFFSFRNNMDNNQPEVEKIQLYDLIAGGPILEGEYT